MLEVCSFTFKVTRFAIEDANLEAVSSYVVDVLARRYVR